MAICKDLGQPYEEYQQKLAKLERIHSARTQSSANGALTRQENNRGPETVREKPVSRTPEAMEYKQNEPSPPPSREKSIGSTPQPKHSPVKQAVEDDDEDEWGDADVGDLLAD